MPACPPVLAAADPLPATATRIAILGNTTTGFLVPVLKALCLRDRVTAHFYEGVYGSQQQEIVSPESGLASFGPHIAILPAAWRELHLPSSLGAANLGDANLGDANLKAANLDAANKDASASAAAWVAGQAQLWQALADRFQCHVVQCAFDYPLQEPYGLLGNTLPGGRTRVIEALNRQLWDHAPGYVSILDTAELQRSAGAAWEDPQAWFSYQQHPAPAALPELAESLMAHIRAARGLTRKVLVTDLDHTLWKGVIGEDGLNGIQVGPPVPPRREAHQQLQQYLLDLKKRGVLLAVSSKNNPEDARLPFEQHSGMVLRHRRFRRLSCQLGRQSFQHPPDWPPIFHSDSTASCFWTTTRWNASGYARSCLT